MFYVWSPGCEKALQMRRSSAAMPRGSGAGGMGGGRLQQMLSKARLAQQNTEVETDFCKKYV